MPPRKPVTKKAKPSPTCEASYFTDFVETYLDVGCAETAARVHAIALGQSIPQGCYVYLLLCPDRQNILYIGKGTGDRMHDHVKEVRSGRISGVKKFKALLRFMAEGKQPVPVIICTDITAREAIRIERQLIAAIGLDRLANATSGQTSADDKSIAHLAWTRTKRKSFCRWLVERNPTPAEIGSYAEHFTFLRHAEKRLRDAAA